VQSHRLVTEASLAEFVQHPPPGAGAGVLDELRQIAETGGWVLVELAVADLPSDLRWLFESRAVTLQQLAALNTALGIATAADLITEVRRRAVGRVTGLDSSVEAAIAAALPELRASSPPIALGRAVATAEPILNRLRGLPGVEWAEPVGSLRRGQDVVGDVEIVAATDDPSAALAEMATLPDRDRIRHQGPQRIYFLVDRLQVGVRCSAIASAGATLLHLTGSPSHVDRLYHRAADRGLSLDPEGLHASSSGRLVASSEAEIYAALDLPFIAPELRSGDDEIEVAGRGQLPELVTRMHIRGDLHMHSHWSDGRDSIEAMVQGSVALGYQYMAITDHSPHSAASRNLSLEGVERQADEIAALRERYPTITILHGVEVDILPNGQLDFADRVLRGFDIVLASLHEQAGHGRDELMRRYLGAMVHPLVSIITHPMNRLVPHRRGYELNVARLFEAAAETRTVLEIDGAPSHLDLDGALAREAIAAGAMVAIDSDAHRADMLDRHMALGLLTARRGWVEPRHVLNARAIQEVKALIAAKRRR
jgi:DNA polymerase (family 10)